MISNLFFNKKAEINVILIYLVVEVSVKDRFENKFMDGFGISLSILFPSFAFNLDV